ncbi:MAG: hypothetical protein Q8P02_03485 [Candidatus Micrarchaeota archaeon]|nr:hypothetical protein [Candidatus Micrarchaeota archaeon]
MVDAMDPARMEQIDRWAQYVRTSNGAWKKAHSAFINAQFQKAEAFYQRLAKTPGGKRKIASIFGIQNPSVLSFLD